MASAGRLTRGCVRPDTGCSMKIEYTNKVIDERFDVRLAEIVEADGRDHAHSAAVTAVSNLPNI